MIVFVDERRPVIHNYETLFAREGISMTGLSSRDFGAWVETAPESDLSAVEAILLGDCENRIELPKKIRSRSLMPVLAVVESNSLEQTLKLFRAGIDDVLIQPVHVHEILARVSAICRRANMEPDSRREGIQVGPIRIFNDGRDPEIKGREMLLPRRERQILEYLVNNRSRRVNKTQIFSVIYGVFNAEVEENVVESHISKLRKKLKDRLGYDVIDSKRFLGYRLQVKE